MKIGEWYIFKTCFGYRKVKYTGFEKVYVIGEGTYLIYIFHDEDKGVNWITENLTEVSEIVETF